MTPETAEKYFREVIKLIDDVFGDGYAKANPALVAGMLQVCAGDFGACMISNALDRVAEAIQNSTSAPY